MMKINYPANDNLPISYLAQQHSNALLDELLRGQSPKLS